MSLWRKEASQRLPELQSTIASPDVDSPMMLWIELKLHFEKACEESTPPIDLIRRIWNYAEWCMQYGHDDAATGAALGFCEHLIDTKTTRQVLPAIMSRRDYEGLRDLLLYHNTEQEYEKALRLFTNQQKA